LPRLAGGVLTVTEASPPAVVTDPPGGGSLVSRTVCDATPLADPGAATCGKGACHR